MAADKKSSAPIGIFDSGIGGLTVANAIRQLLPCENLLYFGDTAHLPYGDKSPDAIKGYAAEITGFLLQHDCKMIVIACNTASSLAYDVVKIKSGREILLVDVINPVVEKVAAKKIMRIGVIGTRATIRSDVYAQKIKEKNAHIEIASIATPLLAPMIEEGFFNNKISSTIINSYLSRPKIRNIDALILACTHYPLIKKEIEHYYNHTVEIIDSAEIVAQHVKKLLRKKGLLNKKNSGQHRFYVSDFTKSFEQSTKLFFKGKIKLEKMNLWR